MLIEREWNKEMDVNEKPSLTRALVRIWRMKIFLNSLIIIIEECYRIALPLLVSELLEYFSDRIDFSYAIMLGLSIVAGLLFTSITHHTYFHNIVTYGMRMKTSCIGMVYRKVRQSIDIQISSRCSRSFSFYVFSVFTCVYRAYD